MCPPTNSPTSQPSGQCKNCTLSPRRSRVPAYLMQLDTIVILRSPALPERRIATFWMGSAFRMQLLEAEAQASPLNFMDLLSRFSRHHNGGLARGLASNKNSQTMTTPTVEAAVYDRRYSIDHARSRRSSSRSYPSGGHWRLEPA